MINSLRDLKSPEVYWLFITVNTEPREVDVKKRLTAESLTEVCIVSGQNSTAIASKKNVY
jgi:hypothetical protein